MNSTSNGFLMIRSFEIRNFRCYKRLHVEDCKRINVIVGDNGSGKTALLEAIFMTLASSTEVALRLRQHRGFDGFFQGTTSKIEKAFWGDYFYNGDTEGKRIEIVLSGDGPENRSLQIAGLRDDGSLPFEGWPEVTRGPIIFIWRNHKNEVFHSQPIIKNGKISLSETGEDNPFFFHFGSLQIASSLENADRFSELSRQNKHREFVTSFKNEYPLIDDMGIEVSAGSAAIFAKINGSSRKIPLTSLSGSINRVVSILLSIASSDQRSAVLTIDEIENGVYYKHQEAMWRQLLRLSYEKEAQIFATTHSLECLYALAEAARKENQIDEIAVWRVQRDENGEPQLLQFRGSALASTATFQGEIRSGASGDEDE
ncbi:MAG: AAA family ATPase [Methylocystis sp.]